MNVLRSFMQYYNKNTNSFMSKVPSNLNAQQLASAGIYQYITAPAPDYNKYTERLFYGEVEFGEITCWQAVTVRPVLVKEIPMRIEMCRHDLLTEIKTKADALSHELKAKYTIWEVDSWPEQEAHAHLVMQSEPIPENSILYTILAGKNKGLPVEQQLNLQQLAEKVRHNVAAARAAAKLILYQQNALEEAIKLALSVEELEAISIEYQM